MCWQVAPQSVSGSFLHLTCLFEIRPNRPTLPVRVTPSIKLRLFRTFSAPAESCAICKPPWNRVLCLGALRLYRPEVQNYSAYHQRCFLPILRLNITCERYELTTP